MHIEIQVALNFVISYLYNKLPRRRVNLFGEELEKALKERFQGHWYPEKPFKGSAFRCLRTGQPTDAVLDRAARESGVPIADILENLPTEMAVWVDPGEVSYRVGEKGTCKILYSELNSMLDDSCADREVTKTFNPEAPCFRPIEAVSSSLGALSLSPKGSPHGSSPIGVGASTLVATNGLPNVRSSPTVVPNNNNNGGQPLFGGQQQHHHQQQHQQSHHMQQLSHQHQQQSHHHHNQHHHQHQQQKQQQHHHVKTGAHNNNAIANNGSGNTVSGSGGKLMGAISPAPTVGTAPFLPRSQATLTFTTATFAQTKFGSTKLKTSSKRANSNMLTALSIPRSRMSPTEFSNYIKQRAMQQHGSNTANNHLGPIGSVSPARSISPNPLTAALAGAHSPDPYYFGNNASVTGGAGNPNISPMSLYPPLHFGGLANRSLFDAGTASSFDGLYGAGGKFQAPATTAGSAAANNYLETNGYFGLSTAAGLNGNGIGVAMDVVANAANNTNNVNGGGSAALPQPIGTGIGVGTVAAAAAVVGSQLSSSSGDSSPSSSGSGGSTAADGAKLLDGLNSFYTSSGPYQHLLVAN